MRSPCSALQSVLGPVIALVTHTFVPPLLPSTARTTQQASTLTGQRLGSHSGDAHILALQTISPKHVAAQDEDLVCSTHQYRPRNHSPLGPGAQCSEDPAFTVGLCLHFPCLGSQLVFPLAFQF